MMFDKPAVHYTENCARPDRSDPDYAVAELAPFYAQGALYVPSQELCGATFTHDDGSQVYLIMLRAGEIGVAQPLTPLAAREFAASIVRGADEIEARQAEAAKAQLSATLSKGKPA